jgi:magnesium-transporting ATPase (P-type)
MNKDKKSDIVDDANSDVVSWHAITIDECIIKLKGNQNLLQIGLSSKEAVERLAQYGPNKMSQVEKETIWQKIWNQVANVLVFILIMIAAVSAARAIVEMVVPEEPNGQTILTSWVQVGLIILVITVNTYIGIKQEGSAEEAAEALKNMLSADARVLRDGEEKLIPADEVVPVM